MNGPETALLEHPPEEIVNSETQYRAPIDQAALALGGLRSPLQIENGPVWVPSKKEGDPEIPPKKDDDEEEDD